MGARAHDEVDAAGAQVLMLRLLLPLALLLALAASACGGETGGGSAVTAASSSAQSAVASASQKSSDAGSARASFTANFTGATSGTMTGEGEFSNREGHLTLDMSDLGGGAFGDGTAELTFSDLVYYMKLPQGAGLPLPPGKEWFKIDLKQLGQTQGLDLEQLTQLSQSDPSQALDFLQGASDDFHEVGDRGRARRADDALHGHRRPATRSPRTHLPISPSSTRSSPSWRLLRRCRWTCGSGTTATCTSCDFEQKLGGRFVHDHGGGALRLGHGRERHGPVG